MVDRLQAELNKLTKPNGQNLINISRINGFISGNSEQFYYRYHNKRIACLQYIWVINAKISKIVESKYYFVSITLLVIRCIS